MKAVIVKFGKSKFSVKSERVCYWCRSRYWQSEDDVKEELTDLEFVGFVDAEKIKGMDFHREISKLLTA